MTLLRYVIGWGDVGYISRWTMEITNNSRYYSIPLVVGRRIAQIVFFDTDGTLSTGQRSYESSGKYQSDPELENLKIQWKPSDMLPKMYKDRECASFKK
jgi:dCTP deaminase